MTPLSHQHHHELPSSYMSTPVEAAYGSRKRTHSSAEGLQTSPFLQDQLHGPIDKGSTAGLDTQYSRNTAGMRPSNQPSSMPQGLDRTAAALEERRTSGPLMHPGDDTSEDAITLWVLQSPRTLVILTSNVQLLRLHPPSIPLPPSRPISSAFEPCKCLCHYTSGLLRSPQPSREPR